MPVPSSLVQKNTQKKKVRKVKPIDRSDPYDPDPIMPFLVKKDIADDKRVKETDVFEGKTKSNTKKSKSNAKQPKSNPKEAKSK